MTPNPRAEDVMQEIITTNRRMRKLLKDFYPHIGFQSGGKGGDKMFRQFKERFKREVEP